jgi:hypothetical protein
LRSASLIEVLLTVAFYGVTGFALVAAAFWYVNSLYTTVTGRGEVVIAPFELVRPDGDVDRSRGTALAHMLQAQLLEIERDIESAQAQLVGAPPTAAAAPEVLAATPRGAIALNAPIPLVFTQGVGLKTKLLDPAEIKVSVAGVEVGGVVSWLQRQVVRRRTVVFTVYERKRGMRVTGSVVALGLRDGSLAVEVAPETGETTVGLDRVVERVAYEVVQRRLAALPNNRVEALDGPEFEALVKVLRDTARLNRQMARGHTAPQDFKTLLPVARGLAESVDGWYQLSYLAASIAESAQDWPAAESLYARAQAALPKDVKPPELPRTIEVKLDEVREKQVVRNAQATAQAITAPEAASAQQEMQARADEANAFFNTLLGQQLPPVPVKLQADPDLKYSPYYDARNIVAAADVRNLPDLTFRNAAWPHLLAVTGPVALDANDALTDIAYSYADVFTMLMHQHHLRQDAASSDWVLGKGYVEWVKGRPLQRPFEGTPYLSFEKPGQAYNDPRIGKDRQVAHMRDAVTSRNPDRRYVNSGILNHAFYLAAKALGTKRAGEIWIAALRQVKERADFPHMARLLHGAAGNEAPAVLEALRQVGLDPTAPAARAARAS